MKISVVIPLYNKKETVARAIGSVLSQTCPPEEIIVVNDGSTDGSEKVVEEMNHSLIRLISQPNAGVSAARNRGISEAKGEWIAFLDADDEWLNGFLATIIFLSDKYPQCSVLATSYLYKETSGAIRKIILRKIPFAGEDGILKNYFSVAAHSNSPLCASAVVVKKLLIKEVGGFPEDIHSGEDLVTWARLACKSDIAYSLVPNAVYWLNPPTVIDRRKEEYNQPDKVVIVLKALKRDCKRHNAHHIRQYISLWHKMRASVYFMKKHNRANAFKEIIKSIESNPCNFRVYKYLFLLFLPDNFVKELLTHNKKSDHEAEKI